MIYRPKVAMITSTYLKSDLIPLIRVRDVIQNAAGRISDASFLV